MYIKNNSPYRTKKKKIKKNNSPYKFLQQKNYSQYLL